MNQDQISWGIHKNWFYKKINSDASTLYLVESEETPIGQVRIDKIDGEAQIDYLIARQFRGLGFGKEVLSMALNKYWLTWNIKIVGLVKKNNVASRKIFESLGFEPILESDIIRYEKVNSYFKK